MKRWALVKDGRVLSAFDGADDKNAYPDIADRLIEVAADVLDNDLVNGQGEKVAAPARRLISGLEFFLRFTEAERDDIFDSRKWRHFAFRLPLESGVNLDSANVQAYMAGLVVDDILTEERKAEILA